MKETLQEFYDRLLIDKTDHKGLYQANITLWGMLIGNLTKEEEEKIDKAAMALEDVLLMFCEKSQEMIKLRGALARPVHLLK